MKTLKWLPLILTIFIGAGGTAQAAKVMPGAGGIAANVQFIKRDLNKNAQATIVRSGAGIPRTTSIAWCDPAANPLAPGASGESFDACYGSANRSRWVVLDFNRLRRQGVGKVRVEMTARRYQSGDPAAGDLVPALTVYRGMQQGGISGSWFPNRFQDSPSFWATALRPFTGGTTQSSGWSSAYSEQGGIETISVDGELKLLAGRRNANNNYLTVAVGGDDRKLPAHDVDFELLVKVTKPVARVGAFDACGCPAGTLWHPEMNHCMAEGLCDLDQYKGQCQTGAQCAACGGKRTLPGGRCP